MAISFSSTRRLSPSGRRRLCSSCSAFPFCMVCLLEDSFWRESEKARDCDLRK